MTLATKLAFIPLAAFLLSAFSARSFAAPGDSCDLYVKSDGAGGWTPSCEGVCGPGACKAPVPHSGAGVTRWWCDCNGIRGGEDVDCEAVLIFDSNYPEDPWSGRCYTNNCFRECDDFPELDDLPGVIEAPLCPCVL